MHCAKQVCTGGEQVCTRSALLSRTGSKQHVKRFPVRPHLVAQAEQLFQRFGKRSGESRLCCAGQTASGIAMLRIAPSRASVGHADASSRDGVRRFGHIDRSNFSGVSDRRALGTSARARMSITPTPFQTKSQPVLSLAKPRLGPSAPPSGPGAPCLRLGRRPDNCRQLLRMGGSRKGRHACSSARVKRERAHGGKTRWSCC
jgi:hypothetical protein